MTYVLRLCADARRHSPHTADEKKKGIRRLKSPADAFSAL